MNSNINGQRFHLVLSFVLCVSCIVLSSAHADELNVNATLPNLGTKVGVTMTDSGLKTVRYQDTGRFGLFEGDILVIPAQSGIAKFEARTTDGVVIDGFRWPAKTLHYRFDSVTQAVKDMVRAATQHITDSTGVVFIELPAQVDAGTPYHVRVQDDDFACYSYVGRLKPFFSDNHQALNVVPQCGFGATVHEFLHALGMYHEQSREDRDDHVTILFQNIESGKEHNFGKAVDDASDIAEYSYGSIMHYSRYAFSKNGLPTIESKPPGSTLGQRDGMSESDIKSINDAYSTSEGAIIPTILFLLE